MLQLVFSLQLDSNGITKIAKGSDVESLLKTCCKKGKRPLNISSIVNERDYMNSTAIPNTTWTINEESYCIKECKFLLLSFDLICENLFLREISHRRQSLRC